MNPKIIKETAAPSQAYSVKPISIQFFHSRAIILHFRNAKILTQTIFSLIRRFIFYSFHYQQDKIASVLFKVILATFIYFVLVKTNI